MKKILLVVSVILLSTLKMNAQVDQLTALKNIPEKTEFVAVKLDWDSDGKIITYPQSTIMQLSYKNDDIGNLGSFYIAENYYTNKKADPAQERPNHATKPSIFYSTYTGTGSVIIGQMVYVLKRNKLANILDGNFTIAKIHEIKSKDSKEHKKQLKGKSTNLLTIDHNKILKDYFIAMKKIQADASINMSEDDKKNAELAKQKQEEKEKERMKKVTADFNDSKQPSPIKVAIKNNTSETKCVVVNNTGYSLEPGEQKSFHCNVDIYYGASHGAYCSEERGALIISKDSSCNKVVTLD